MASSSRVFLGASALAAANAAKIGLQLLLLPILARTLGPQAFGLVALAMSFILLANFLSDGGMNTSLVRVAAPSRELESTVFWLSLALGGSLAAIMAALALPLARAFEQPALAETVLALCPVLLISAGLAVSNSRITRARRLGVFALADLLSVLAGAAVALTLAFRGHGHWALVAQQLVIWGVRLFIVPPAAGFRPALVCRPRMAIAHLKFGLTAVGASMAEFATRSGAMVITGALLTVAAVGHYSMAFQIIRIPELVISGPVAFTIFASVARISEDRDRAAELLLKSLRIMTTALAPVFFGLALVAAPVVALLFGEPWAPTAPIIAALAPAAFLSTLYIAIGWALLGMGRAPRHLALASALMAATLACALAGAPFGSAGVAAGVSLAHVLLAPLFLRALKAAFGVGPSALAAGLAHPLAAASGMAVVVLIVLRQSSGHGLIMETAAPILAGVVAYPLLLTALSGKGVWLEIRSLWSSRGAPEAPGG